MARSERRSARRKPDRLQGALPRVLARRLRSHLQGSPSRVPSSDAAPPLPPPGESSAAFPLRTRRSPLPPPGEPSAAFHASVTAVHRPHLQGEPRRRVLCLLGGRPTPASGGAPRRVPRLLGGRPPLPPPGEPSAAFSVLQGLTAPTRRGALRHVPRRAYAARPSCSGSGRRPAPPCSVPIRSSFR